MNATVCTHGVEYTRPCDACFHAHMTRDAAIRQAPPDRTRPRLTLHECTALQLAALAALDNVPASLSAATCNDLRDALAKLDRATVVLAGPARSGAAAGPTVPAKPKSKQVAAAKQRDQKRDHGQRDRDQSTRPVRRKR